MLIYITIRFEVRSGLAAVLALTHDVLIMLTCYSLFRIPVNTSFIAAILTILGYSINATIIVFDRIREGMRGATKKTVISDVVEKKYLEHDRPFDQYLGHNLADNRVVVLHRCAVA